ncbi:hypothetical protein RclHR1_13240004 [Rhizophagus clarus]|uniref:Uncharacterized protein n=1 Tax=Rhizophagus clarus TaxID=94130 RepID=A0A2Z6Q9K7_9GLOM|nr:hypothetical protein RclHR1_13240004 [Rhizophagus clarus]
MVPIDKLSRNIHRDDCFPIIAQFLATFLNLFLLDDENQEIFLMDSEIRWKLEYASKQSSNKEDLGDPMHQSDASMNFNVFDTNLIGSLDDVDELLATPSRNITPIPVITESSKYTPSKPSDSRTVTFNQSLLSPPSTPYKQQLKRDSKSQSTLVDNEKKLKQKETDNTLKNRNVIITGYLPQDQEQAHLLDLVVYDILAK